MFPGFGKTEEGAADVKQLRQQLLRFIKEKFQQWEGGEGGNIRSMVLYLNPPEEARGLYETAVFTGEEGRFKTEVQRLADDYALDLPADWQLETSFAPAPPSAMQANGIAAALLFSGRQQAGVYPLRDKAFVQVLSGEAEQARYPISRESGKVTIGRDRLVQAADGFHRENKIAFVAASTHEANKFVSRQHAHIEWSEASGTFLLFADEGGIPPRNKVKVRPRGGEPVKLQSTHIGYSLQPGDQIMLGDAALLEFGLED